MKIRILANLEAKLLLDEAQISVPSASSFCTNYDTYGVRDSYIEKLLQSFTISIHDSFTVSTTHPQPTEELYAILEIVKGAPNFQSLADLQKVVEVHLKDKLQMLAERRKDSLASKLFKKAFKSEWEECLNGLPPTFANSLDELVQTRLALSGQRPGSLTSICRNVFGKSLKKIIKILQHLKNTKKLTSTSIKSFYDVLSASSLRYNNFSGTFSPPNLKISSICSSTEHIWRSGRNDTLDARTFTILANNKHRQMNEYLSIVIRLSKYNPTSYLVETYTNSNSVTKQAVNRVISQEWVRHGNTFLKNIDKALLALVSGKKSILPYFDPFLSGSNLPEPLFQEGDHYIMNLSSLVGIGSPIVRRLSNENAQALFNQLAKNIYIASISYDEDSDQLTIHTNNIMLEEPLVKIEKMRPTLFGRYRIVIKEPFFNPRWKEIINITRMPTGRALRSYGTHHPHCTGGSGSYCLGNIRDSVEYAKQNGDLPTLVNLLIAFLKSANKNDSAGERYRSWNPAHNSTVYRY